MLICGLGASVPGDVMDNEALIARFGLSVTPAWIVERTGILSRHWLEEGRTTSDLATEAAQAALADAGWAPTDVDRLILATVSPDMPSPSTATRVLHKLGARCAAFDLNATCAGFLYGLALSREALLGGCSRVLLVCAEARSRFIRRDDHRAAVLFADGAAALCLERGGSGGLRSVFIGGEGMTMLGAWVPAGGAERPTTLATVDAGLHYLHVEDKREIFHHFLRFVEEAAAAALAAAGLTIDQIDLLVPHQGNARLTEAIGARLGVPPERVVNTIPHHGNVSGASIPLALHDLRAAGRLVPGTRLLLVAAGAGAAYGAAVYEVPA
jgi:3-oxoacyl-[acyl-carrier-protein] synthase-3